MHSLFLTIFSVFQPVKKHTKKGVRKSLEGVLDTDSHVPKRCKSLSSHKGKPHETQKQISAENENQDFVSPGSITCPGGFY